MKIAFMYQSVGIQEEHRKAYESMLQVQLIQCKSTPEKLPQDCGRMIAQGVDALIVFSRALVKRIEHMNLPIPVIVGEPTIGNLLFSLLQVKKELGDAVHIVAVDCSVNFSFAGNDVQEAYRWLEKLTDLTLVNIEREKTRNPQTRAAELHRLKELGVDAVIVPASIGAENLRGFGIPVYNNINSYTDESNYLSVKAAISELQELSWRRKELQMMRQLIEMSPQVLMCLNEEGRIQFASAKAQNLLNCSELKDKSLGELLPQLQQPVCRILDDSRGITGYPVNIGDTVWSASLAVTTQEQKERFVLCTLTLVKRIHRIEQSAYQQLSQEGSLAIKTFSDLQGNSQAFRRTMSWAQKYALCELPVFITGEAGTGKRTFAQAIHNAGVRRMNAFVHMDCAAEGEHALETLFGVGPNGAKGGKPYKGVLERASGGTLFLEKIEALPLGAQQRLQYTLNRRSVRRLGDESVHPIDVRIIVCTDRDPDTLMEEQLLSPGLFYQLDVLRLQVPPLRERSGDTMLLFDLYFRRACEIQARVIRLSESARRQLENYFWPGNITELIAICQRISILADGDDADEALIAGCFAGKMQRNGEPQKATLHEAEMQRIREALQKCGGSRAKAAQLLGISTTTLWRRCREMDVESDTGFPEEN